jgi:hypothetical protein
MGSSNGNGLGTAQRSLLICRPAQRSSVMLGDCSVHVACFGRIAFDDLNLGF